MEVKPKHKLTTPRGRRGEKGGKRGRERKRGYIRGGDAVIRSEAAGKLQGGLFHRSIGFSGRFSNVLCFSLLGRSLYTKSSMKRYLINSNYDSLLVPFTIHCDFIVV